MKVIRPTLDIEADLLTELLAPHIDLALVGTGIRGVHLLDHQIPLAAVGHVLHVDARVLHPRARADGQRGVLGQLAPRDLWAGQKRTN